MCPQVSPDLALSPAQLRITGLEKAGERRARPSVAMGSALGTQAAAFVPAWARQGPTAAASLCGGRREAGQERGAAVKAGSCAPGGAGGGGLGQWRESVIFLHMLVVNVKHRILTLTKKGSRAKSLT